MLSRKAPMKPGTKPMARTPFKPSIVPSSAGVKPEVKAKRMKSKGPRMTPIRKAARGQDCTLRIPGVCNWNPETTVLCHSPYLESGRGMGIKAPDTDACFGCDACHGRLDRRVPWPSWMTPFKMEAFFVQARKLTHEILTKMRLMP